jgi:hypothetical protein
MGQPLVDMSLAAFDAAGRQIVFPISPFGASETRAERIARLEALGVLAPGCPTCAPAYAHPTLSAFMPQHRAGAYCRSGKRNHCTCDGCF